MASTPLQTSSSPILRSVAMSANIASTVRDEVKHLFKVDSFPVLSNDMNVKTCDQRESSSEFGDTHSSDLDSASFDFSSYSACSHVLPIEEESIVSAVVLSRWDDIMGPRTVHVWLPEIVLGKESNLLKIKNSPYNSPSSVKNACQFTCFHSMSAGINAALLMKAIKYVTSHTVNYTCVTGVATPECGSSAIFVVPDLDIVAQSLMFHVPLDASSPYSLALLIKYSSYEAYLPLRSLCQHWLEKLTCKLTDFLLTVSGVEVIDGRELPQSTMVDDWFTEMCSVFLSVRVSGLCEISALQSYLSPGLLGHPIIERAVTSHLQTGGCTIVMGATSSNVNSMISFLALFLDEEARCCSRYARSGQRDGFQTGLYLQGLLLDEFGCRELSSEELVDNPLPVTWIDLSRSPSAVRQGLPLHLHQKKTVQAQNFMRIVKEDSALVRSLVRDLRQLPPHQWSSIINMFLHRLSKLAQSLLNIIHWNGVPSFGFNGTAADADNATIHHLCGTLHIDYPTFLIVLSTADKLKPGSYRLVMKGTPNSASSSSS